MEQYTKEEKNQLRALKNALRREIKSGEYWISQEKVHLLMELAGPFSLPATLKEMGYRIVDRSTTGHIHIGKC